MEEILLTIVSIVVVICYTVYKIDCNHVNKPKNNYPTGGLSGHRSLEKPKKAKGTKIPPRSKTVNHERFTEEERIAMFGKDYVVEKKPASDELKEYLKHKAEENRKESE